MKINLILIYLIYVFDFYSCAQSSTSTNTHSHTATNTNLKSGFKSSSKISFKFSEMARRFHATDNAKIDSTIAPEIPNLPAQAPNDQNTIKKENIFWEGWINYFKYDHDKNSETKPKAFFINDQYLSQLREGSLENNVDSSNKIKGEHYFYAYLFKDSLNIMTSKLKSYDGTIDVIDIPTILKSKDAGYNGGIIDRGKRQEGFCLEIIISRPAGKSNTEYLICLDNASDKNSFITKLKELRINYDKEHGLYIDENNNDSATDPTVINVSNNSNVAKIDGNQSALDGYWVTIQEWTECNLKCGGGESYLQRVCVPPVKGGKDCQGEPFLIKKCNSLPCPEINLQQNNPALTTTKSPVIKIGHFMNRPQRYEKCKIQESDLLMFIDLKDLNLKNIEGKTPKMVRVVMNSRTVSMFNNEDYNSNLMSFNIKKTKLKPSNDNPYCFTIYDIEFPKKNAELCAFDFKDSKMIKEWQSHFEEFKNICRSKLEAVSFEVQKTPEENEKLIALKEDISLQQQGELNQLLNNKKENELESTIVKARDMGFDIIQKELLMEEKVRLEESQKEKDEIESMKAECEKAEKKSKILEEAVLEKENESNLMMKEAVMREVMKGITNTTVDELKDTRKQFIKSINNMKLKTNVEKFLLKKKMIGIKMKMTTALKDKYKKGELAICFEIKENATKRLNFCRIAFQNDPNEYQSCIGDHFCIACCNVQFGSAMTDEREQCYQKLCDNQKK